MIIWAWFQGDKTKAVFVLTDNHPVNYSSDTICVGTV